LEVWRNMEIDGLLTTTGFSLDNYGKCLNQIMEASPFEWVMIHDHDIFFCHPEWYRIVCQNIKDAKNAGLLTCVTNRIGCSEQKVKPNRYEPDNNNLDLHRAFAIKVQYRGISEAKKPISGLVMVTSKTAWKKAGGFREKGIIGVDNDYHRRIVEAGYKVYIMNNLYMFHWYRQPIIGYKEK